MIRGILEAAKMHVNGFEFWQIDNFQRQNLAVGYNYKKFSAPRLFLPSCLSAVASAEEEGGG